MEGNGEIGEMGNGVASKDLTFRIDSLSIANFKLVSWNKSEEEIERHSIRFRNATEL